MLKDKVTTDLAKNLIMVGVGMPAIKLGKSLVKMKEVDVTFNRDMLYHC